MEQEIWKYHSDFGKSIEFSNLGRVKSYYRYSKGKILNNRDINNLGYVRIKIAGKRYSLHRFIAELFVPNPENKPEVNHKDGDKQNNRADNLEWTTRSENQKHAYKLGLQKPSEKQRRTVSRWNKENRTKKIYQYDIEDNLIKIYNSCKDCSQFFGVSEATISRCCTQHKLYKGYKLSYRKEVSYGGS